MTDIEFQLNHFRVYKTSVDGLSLGFIDTGAGAYTPARGEEIEYDGSTVVLKDGRTFHDVPQLRGAIAQGWFDLVDGATPSYRPKPAGIQVRAAEQRGQGRVVKSVVETVRAEEREVISVDDRRRKREQVNERAAQNVALASTEARSAMHGWATEDVLLNELVSDIDQDLRRWKLAHRKPTPPVDLKARAEADILELLSSIAEGSEPESPKARQLGRASVMPVHQDDSGLVGLGNARRLPVEREESLRMPVVAQDQTENTGPVVGTVAQRRTQVEQERLVDISVAPAKPVVSVPARPRFGAAGAIVVDEQRDMGTIVLSNDRAPIQIDESAKVVPNSSDMIRMASVEVGPRAKQARTQAADGDQGGVTVGRILSPTKRTFTATDANTSEASILRAQEGTMLKVERVATRTPVATGDVQEARGGDELTDLLPDAVTPPEVAVATPVAAPAEDPTLATIKLLIPDFEWNRDRPLKERVTDALSRFKNAQYVKAILAVETEIARDEIKKGLAALLKKGGGKGKAKAS